MRAHRAIQGVIGGLLAAGLAAGSGAAQELPVVKGRKVVATVQGEPITKSEFDQQVAAMRRELPPGAAPDRASELALLDRMISTVLVAQEARRMGLDKLPEVRKVVESNAHVALREELVERVVKDVTADPAAVDKIYRATVRQWKVSAVLFEREEAARSMATELAAGRGFEELARSALADGRAAKMEEGAVLRRESIDPKLGQAVAGLAPGAASPVVATRSGFVIVKLDEILYPDNPAERAKAEQIVLTGRRKEAVTAFDEGLRKKWVKVHREVLDRVDYDAAAADMDALLKDRRVVAEVKGESPVTVGDLTEQLKFQFFHGAAMAAEKRKLNARKQQVLDGMLHRKVFRKEALRLGLDKTDAYRDKIKEFEAVTLFEALVRKVIVPGIRLNEEAVKAYYDEHRARYSTPEMIRIRSLAFADRKRAESAAESLRQGADFQWVAGQAAGQVEPNTPGLLTFDGRPIMTSELPEGIGKALAGARAGDVRLYASGDAPYVYVLTVPDVLPAQPQPYEQVRREVAERVLDAEIQRGIEEYAAKLRSLSDVKVYLGPARGAGGGGAPRRAAGG